MAYQRLPDGRVIWSRNKRLNREKAKLRDEGNYGGLKSDPKKALGTKKPKAGSLRDLEKKLECRNARYVKLRDGFRCRQWGDPKIKCMGRLDCGHIYPKGLFPGGKYLPANLIAQCRRRTWHARAFKK